jgi:hypothetical protein
MLISKGVVSGEIVSLKLTTGEEVISKLVEETATGYKVSKPVVLSMTNQGIGMIPFMLTISGDTDVVINHSSIVSISVTDKQFADQYVQGTTGIKIV